MSNCRAFYTAVSRSEHGWKLDIVETREHMVIHDNFVHGATTTTLGPLQRCIIYRSNHLLFTVSPGNSRIHPGQVKAKRDY